MKQIFKQLLAGAALTLTLTACHNDTYGDKEVTYQDIFPIETIENRWHYSDKNGNKLSIRVIDTITDDGDRLFKTQFYEEVVKSTKSYWFLLNNSEVMYSNSLRDEYTKLLPKSYKDDEGSFWVSGSKVKYELHNSYSTSKSQYSDVVELDYSDVTLDGFSKIVFADDYGPIRLVDNSGRWTITYDLDSAYVEGRVVYSE